MVATTPEKTLNQKIFEPQDYSQSIFRQILVWVQKKKLPPPYSMTIWSVVYDPLPPPLPTTLFCKRIGAETERDRDLEISDKVDFITFCGLGYVKIRSDPSKGP